MTHREGLCTGTTKSVSRYDIYLRVNRGLPVYCCTPRLYCPLSRLGIVLYFTFAIK